MRPRVWILPLSAVLIAGLCTYRATRPDRPVPTIVKSNSLRALPPRGWELPDHEFRLVKFDRYLGRQPLIVLFCDGSHALDADPLLIWLRDHAAAVYAAGWRIIAITTANPAAVRRAAEQSRLDWPFPVLTDMHLRDPAPAPVHHLWSRVDRATGALLPALFLVDRLGYIEYVDGRPRPEPDPVESLERIVGNAT